MQSRGSTEIFWSSDTGDDEIEDLPLAVAIDLAHALVAGVAESAGIRALFIKGPVANHHGIRRHRVSSDVDVLVLPGDVEALRDALLERGWAVRPESFAHREFVTHSLTLLHPAWPCDIDIHRSFPGFLESDEVAFDALWRSRTEIEIASRKIAGTDLPASIVIAALHALRAMFLARHSDEFDEALAVVRSHIDSDGLLAEILLLADATGATTTLGPFLRELGVDTPQRSIHHRKYLEWQRNTRQLNRAAEWITAALSVPLAARPRFILRAIFPGVNDLLIDHPATPRTLKGVTRTWLSRLLHAIRALPTAIGDVRAERIALRGSHRRVGPAGDATRPTPSEAQASAVPVATAAISKGSKAREELLWSFTGGAAERDARVLLMRRAADVAEVERDDGTFLLPIEPVRPSVPLLVTGSGRSVWMLLREARSRDDIVALTAAGYGVTTLQVEADVSEFLARLIDARVVEVAVQ